MGQYYKAVIVTDNDEVKGWFDSWDYESGMKLMEHSWVGNHFVKSVEAYLFNNPARLAWSGDYDEVKGFYDKAEEDTHLPKQDTSGITDGHYIINHTKKCAVRVPDEPGEDCPFGEWPVHPLPLLTAMGNGLGGGDYWSEVQKDKVGSWAMDLLEVAYEVPKGYEVQEIIFKED